MYTPEAVSHHRRYDSPRRYPRYLLSFPLSLTRLGQPGQPVMYGMSLDLSRGGGSALLCGPPAVGEMVRVSLRFSGAPLEALAIVRHTNSRRSGFEFLELSPTQQKQLVNHVRTLEGHSWPWQPESTSAASMPCARPLHRSRRVGLISSGKPPPARVCAVRRSPTLVLRHSFPDANGYFRLTFSCSSRSTDEPPTRIV
jgi:hypothetical protein